jgi:hypothetical protein
MPNYFTIDIDGVLTADDYMAPWSGGVPARTEAPRAGMFDVIRELVQDHNLFGIALTARPMELRRVTREWLEDIGIFFWLARDVIYTDKLKKPFFSWMVRAIAHIDDRPEVLMAYYASGISETCRPIHLDPRGRSASLCPCVVRDAQEMKSALIARLDEVQPVDPQAH